MKGIYQFVVSLLIIFTLVVSAVPCGPSYVSPLFTVRIAPENPYLDYAAGRIGIVKPEYHRSVLFAAYRWINGNGFGADEQKALIDVWNAEFRNRDYIDADVTEAVKAWVEKRKDVVGPDEKVPTIYVEREYGGYDFFPNCTKNAFETATETLSSRIGSYGSNNKDVKNWLTAQDAVFSNCSSGKTAPDALQPGSTEWLQKDRAYQMAAAEFYSLNYDDAKAKFAAIASDTDSVWQETADYLVARTLIRQASLSKDPEKTKAYYEEAERHLWRFTSGKFAESAEKMLGLIKYRIRPEERIRELAQKLSGGGNSNFRQDVIDYTWLMDKFEARVLDEAEEKESAERKKVCDELTRKYGDVANAPKSEYPSFGCPSSAANSVNTISNAANFAAHAANAYANTRNAAPIFNRAPGPGNFAANTVTTTNSVDYASNSAANAVNAVANARNYYEPGSSYDGRYYGDQDISLSKLPEFLRYEDLTDWLFTYQIKDNEAYLYSLNKFKGTQSALWLMTALSKATTTSADLNRLLTVAKNVGHSSLAYPTIAYHAARLNLERGQTVEARKILDEALSFSSEMPISSVNEFMKLRLRLAETLEDFLKYSLRKPFAFDSDGTVGSIDDLIAEEKSWYDPEYNKDGKEAFEAEVEKRYEREKQWQGRLMLDGETINLMNQFFPTAVLATVESSEALPDYLRERFAIAVWTRAALFDDLATMNRLAPKLVKYHPEFEDEMKAVTTAAGPIARQNSVLSLIVNNPIFTPFIEDGLGKTDNEVNTWDINDYWCEPYDQVYDEDLGDMVSRDRMIKPKFLTTYQTQMANAERDKLKRIGDAPKYLGEQTIKWAARSPNDKRIPRALYNMFQANGWTKYGCGNNEELQEKIGDLLRRRYPNSEWARKLASDEAENDS